MGPTDRHCQRLVTDQICAVCEVNVTAIQSTPSRQRVGVGSTVYRSSAWCQLQPCGHTFTVRAGGLIH